MTIRHARAVDFWDRGVLSLLREEIVTVKALRADDEIVFGDDCLVALATSKYFPAAF